ncbi:MAG: PD-(D/E)XK nuclease-like domain-containing protein [Burkholderiales bacterium]
MSFVHGHCEARHEPLSQYLANREFVSSSQLRRFARFGAAAVGSSRGGNFAGSEMGEALHCLLLEPEEFAEQYLVLDGSVPPKDDVTEDESARRGWLDAWQWSALCKARDAVLACPQAPVADWLSRGRRELSIYWTDEGGAKWRARPDCFLSDIVLEIKTTTDCRPDSFARTRERLNYDVQAAHYVAAVSQLTGVTPRFAFVTVELAAPYPVWVHELGAAELTRAAEVLERLKGGYLETAAVLCARRGTLPLS